MIGLDNQLGDDGIYPCECRHTTRDLAQDGIDDVAVRWRELVDSGNGKPNRVTKDETVFYALKQVPSSEPRGADQTYGMRTFRLRSAGLR
jgi:hypothetical protein